MFILTIDNLGSLSSSPNVQSQWHGNIETSTDTLVPVIESANQEINEISYSKPAVDNELLPENSDRPSFNFYRSRNSPDMYNNLKMRQPNGSPVMDDSILIQPEQQCMDITNGNQSVTGSVAYMPNGNANNPSLYRRRQNSFNSKAPPTFAEVLQSAARSDSISPITINSKFSLPNANRNLCMNQPNKSINTQSHPATNISTISCPDGLAHALNEQNLRLQQIVHEHKVCFLFLKC